MQKRQQSVFTTIHSEGTLFTGELLQQIAKRATKLEGLTQESYHLLKSAQFNDVITHAWEEALKIWSEYTRDLLMHPERHLALTREWMLKLLPLLNYGRIRRAEPIQTPQRNYAISHSWYHVPIHLVSCETSLDKSVRGLTEPLQSSTRIAEPCRWTSMGPGLQRPFVASPAQKRQPNPTSIYRV